MTKIDNSRVENLLSSAREKDSHKAAYFSDEDKTAIRQAYSRDKSFVVLHGKTFTLRRVDDNALFVKPVIGYAPCCRVQVR